ncbi:MAG: efflux RND transporter permease subunit [Holophagales bacterium]|nr:efflux RND transporter permease subunit [Holophagales bacterium]
MDEGELIDAMAVALADLPGVTINFTQPMAMRLDEVVSGVKADVAVKVFGPDNPTLEKLGEEIRRVLETVRGAADLQVEVLSRGRAGADRPRPRADGPLRPQRRRRADLVETAIGGATATEILDGPRRFAVVVRFPDELRRSPEAIASILLTAPGGEKVPLGNVARIATPQGPEAISHESGQRRLVVQTNVRGRDIGSYVAEGQKLVRAKVTMPSGYHAEWGGQFENQARATKRLMIVIPASLAIIFLLLFLTFRLARQAALVILNVPFALVGGVAALWLRGLNLNLSASVGLHRPLRRRGPERRRDDHVDEPPARGGATWSCGLRS